MIILTQPTIKALSPSRMSTIVCAFREHYCLAEVADDFKLSEKQMKNMGIDFWWEVTGSQLDGSNYKLRKYNGGLIEGIIEQLNVSKEVNLAYGIYSICVDRKADVWQVWERSIKPWNSSNPRNNG